MAKITLDNFKGEVTFLNFFIAIILAVKILQIAKVHRITTKRIARKKMKALLVLMIVHNITKNCAKEHFCGNALGNKIRKERIVGGYDVGFYKYPWYAILIKDGEVNCGGTLIGPKTILTAAHCFKPFLELSNSGSLKLEEIFLVALGIYNNCAKESSRKEFKVKKVVIHENYSERSPYYDISLLLLTEDTKKFIPACLPFGPIKNQDRPKEGFVQGFGRLDFDGGIPCTMQEARILIYSDEVCRNMINRSGNDIKGAENIFCAGYLTGKIDACQGDSGGPLLLTGFNSQYILFGITSFGFGCAEKDYLGVYTDVSQYLDWILENSGLDSTIVDTIYKKPTTTTQVPFLQNTLYNYPQKLRPINIIVIRNRTFRNKIGRNTKTTKNKIG